MTLLGIVFFALSCCIALMNLSGVIAAWVRRWKGIDRGFSCIPMLTFLASCLAFRLAGSTLVGWCFIPVLLDPFTWSLIVLPFFLLWRYIRTR